MLCKTIISKGNAKNKRRISDDVAKENWMALIVAICTKKSCEQSLAAMGIANEDGPKRIDCPYQNKARITYILSRVCGLKVKEITEYLGIGKTTVSRAIGFVHEASIQ